MNPRLWLWVISDMHEDRFGTVYLSKIESFWYSVQIGDLGFNYEFLKNVDPQKHKFFGGNHDNYATIKDQPHNLGDFGEVEHGGVKFYFIRGGHSIDQKGRLLGRDFFAEEELNYTQSKECLKDYEKVRPEIVLTHECPVTVTRELFKDTSILVEHGYDETWSSHTAKLLQECFEIHQPRLWIFGHHHEGKSAIIKGTHFICLRERAALRLDKSQLAPRSN